VIFDPWFGSLITAMGWAALVIIFSAMMNGLYRIFTREIADTEAAETSAIYDSIVGAFGMLLVLPFVWRTPSSPGHVERERQHPFFAEGWLRSQWLPARGRCSLFPAEVRRAAPRVPPGRRS
jgi:hypothetical protein